MQLPGALFGLSPQNFSLRNFYFFLKKTAVKKFLTSQKSFFNVQETEHLIFQKSYSERFPKITTWHTFLAHAQKIKKGFIFSNILGNEKFLL